MAIEFPPGMISTKASDEKSLPFMQSLLVEVSSMRVCDAFVRPAQHQL